MSVRSVSLDMRIVRPSAPVVTVPTLAGKSSARSCPSVSLASTWPVGAIAQVRGSRKPSGGVNKTRPMLSVTRLMRQRQPLVNETSTQPLLC